MSITELAVKRPTALFAIFALFIGLGIMGYFNLGADLFPSTNTPFIGVHIVYPGAGSEEVENDAIKPIEDAVSSLPGIKSVRSASAEGFGYTALEFSMDANPDTAVIDVQKAVDGIMDRLPAAATRPVVRKYNLNARPILIVSLSGNLPYEELYARADDLRRRIENVQGVGQVTLEGGPKKEVEVQVDRSALEAWGLSFQTVIGLLKANNLNAPAGLLRQDGIDRTVRVLGEVSSLEELRGLLLPLPRGGTVPLGEVAKVVFAVPPDSGKVRMDGTSAIGLTIVKASDANVVDATKRIKQAIELESATMPPGVDLKIASDETIFINSSLSETMRDLLIGILSTAIVLWLFLREWRSSLIVLVAIPTSLISTFFMMFVMHFTLNIVSAMALALCIGILVDDSIVVLENIHRHYAAGQDRVRAAIEGRREIGMAAVAITLSDVVVFAPVAFLTDLVGQFFRQFGLTVVFASLFSLFVSFTLTPALASRLIGRGKVHLAPSELEAASETAERPASAPAARTTRKGFFETQIKPRYRAFLEWALGHRAIVIGGILVLFIGAISLIPLGFVATEFMPPFDQGKLVVDMSLDSGSNLDRTDAMVKRVEGHLLSLPETRDVYSSMGGDLGSNVARLTVRLKDKTERRKGQSQIARELREWGAGLPGLAFSVTEQSIVEQTSTEGTKALIINVVGPDRAVLSKLAAFVEKTVQDTPGAVDVDNSMRSRRTEIALRVDRLALSQYGLTVADAAAALRTGLAGSKAGVFRKAGDEYDIVVMFPPGSIKSTADLESIRLATVQGSLVSLGQIAEIGREEAAPTLTRTNRSNVATIQANLQGRALGLVTADIQRKLEANPAPRGYRFDFKGDSSMMSDSFASLGWALAASVFLLYLILLVLYESYLTPLIRMLSLPAGIIGGLAALAITGKAINIIVFIGIIMLDGLASKNGTLLIDYTNTLRKRGLPLREALLESGTTRLRPIMMTSITMIVGMLPLALSTGSSSEIKSSMAILLIGGIAASTLLSPVLIPVVYTLIEDGRNKARELRRDGERRGKRQGRRAEGPTQAETTT
ncbi:MAG TPA: efflux RND transporter permease subunit [Rectinemataceae bacterium]|nr:efflux RND transporter permease subunit [Rectinemataceae bacterium]